MTKKLKLSIIALLCSNYVLANELGNIPTVNVPNSVEMRANPQTGQGMRSVPETMPAVNQSQKVTQNAAQTSTYYQGPRPIGSPQGNTAQNVQQQVQLTPEQRARAKEKAFEEQMETTFPMTDDQIRRFNGKMENLEKAYRQSSNPVPNYVPAEVSVNFGVNNEMPVVMLGANSMYETNLIFTDSTGAAWEVSSFNVANKNEFFATYPENIKGNQLSLMTTAPYGVTSLSVNLKDAPSPLMFQLVTGQPEVYSLFNVKVNNIGPNAPKGTRFGNLNKDFENNEDLETLLTGVVPKGLKELSLTGFNVSNTTFAWASRDGKYIYVRTPMAINAPMPIDGGRIGGTNDNIYQLKRTNFISFAYQGRDVTAKVSGLPMNVSSDTSK